MSQVEFVDPPADAQIGDLITAEGLSGSFLSANVVDKKKVFQAVAPVSIFPIRNWNDHSCFYWYFQGSQGGCCGFCGLGWTSVTDERGTCDCSNSAKWVGKIITSNTIPVVELSIK